MNKSLLMALLVGSFALSACSSNETAVKADEGSMDDDAAVDAAITEMKGEGDEMSQDSTRDSGGSTAGSAGATDSVNGYANKTAVCTNSGSTRTIRVLYHATDAGTRCEVVYEKASGTQTLWNAQSDMNYCVDKAAGFVKKQEGWGWTCSALQ